MTLDAEGDEIGPHDLHKPLSEHLDRGKRGADVRVTRRGGPIARLSDIDAEDSLDDLVKRGLVTPPPRTRSPRRARVKARGSASGFVAEQRR